jgi:hypothetical protein
MPYSKISESRLKKLDGVALTLSQINHIAKMADKIGGDYGWPTAIKNFKRTHAVKGGKWVKQRKVEDKEIHEVFVTKEDDRYKIIGVSTAAVRDREGETFSTQAMDYDIARAVELDDYPEFRMFHKPYLAVGKVTKMSRVGIFAVDEGYAYDDPFSKEVCEKILKDNDGRWRMSRGFYVVEATGGCPRCGEGLVVETKHMIAGFSCPYCSTIHLGYKGTLKDIEFRKTRTFDVTITDIPCVPMTGVSAFKDSEEVRLMNKKELRETLLDAGLTPDVVDERLKDVDEERLKELGSLPQAKLLKELNIEEQDSESNEELFVLDPEVLKDFASVVKEVIEPLVSEAVAEALDDLEIDLGDIEIKEFEGFEELKEKVEELTETVNVLVQSDEERLKEMLEDAPRSSKLRILRSKGGGKKKYPKEDEEEDEEDEEDMVEEKEVDVSEGIVFGSDGAIASSMTEFVQLAPSAE